MNVEEYVKNILIKINDPELLLLKGHLVVEQCINNLLSIYIKDENKFDKLELMFAKKIELYEILSGNDNLIKNIKGQLTEINKLRNKLAHQVNFTDYEDRLKKWACNVLGYTPKSLNRKKTYRNTVAKAFAFLTGHLDGIVEVKKILKK